MRPFLLVSLLAMTVSAAVWWREREIPDQMRPGHRLEYARVTVTEPPLDTATLSAIGGWIARRPVQVDCSLGDQAVGVVGMASIEAGQAILARPICADLAHFRGGLTSAEIVCAVRAKTVCGGTVNQSLIAMHVLAHESYHLAGVTDEAATDCYAVQAVENVARRLGATPELADRLAAYYWRHYRSLRGAPAEYRSYDCRSGGKLDLRPDDDAWPS